MGVLMKIHLLFCYDVGERPGLRGIPASLFLSKVNPLGHLLFILAHCDYFQFAFTPASVALREIAQVLSIVFELVSFVIQHVLR